MAVAGKKRLSRDDWEHAALDAIADGGIGAVAVEPLAAALGVTKGSFYAHFPNRDALIEATLARWERSHGESLSELSAIADPAERLERVMLAAIAFSQSDAPSVHQRLLGELGDARVRATVARVDSARVARLSATYRELGFAPQQATRRARLAYATYVGLLQMADGAPNERLTSREVAALVRELRATLLAPPPRADGLEVAVSARPRGSSSESPSRGRSSGPSRAVQDGTSRR
jgi:AcrR family transcriptional regulator